MYFQPRKFRVAKFSVQKSIPIVLASVQPVKKIPLILDAINRQVRLQPLDPKAAIL
jgi:hypothetical protein